MNADLPLEIRDRVPAPHALRVGVRQARLPSASELAAFCGDVGTPEAGATWIRFPWMATRDSVLVLLEEGKGPAPLGFEHALLVESGLSKAAFLAAYFIARRCGGVVQIRQRAAALAASAFAERYLEEEDLESRWSKAIPDPGP